MKTAALSTPEVLDAIDRGRDRGPIERAVILLGLAEGGGARGAGGAGGAGGAAADRPRLLEIDVARRDRALFGLRARAFGERLEVRASCPKCQESLESELSVAELLAVPEVAAVPGVRLPNSADLLAAAQCRDAAEARALLVRRCVSAPIEVEEGARVLEEAARREPSSDVELAFECAACGQAFVRPLDIASFLWTELEVWAERLLDEVHTLARAYGWREQEILALSPRRRRAYVERVLS